MSATAYWEKRVLDSVFRNVNPFTVDIAYVGLAVIHTEAEPVEYVELPHSDYTRKAIEWTAADETGRMGSADEIIWSPTTNWGTVTIAFIADAMQGGNWLFTTSIGYVNTGAGSKIVVDVDSLYLT